MTFSLKVGSRSPILLQCPTYAYSPGHFLYLPLSGISAPELRSFKQSEAEFAIIEAGPIAVLAFKFGEHIPWSDAAFNVLDGGRASATIIAAIKQSANEGTRALLTCVLVESKTNLIVAGSAMSISPSLTSELNDVLRRQVANGPISDTEMLGRTNALYAKFPSTESLLRVALARSRGGA